MTKTFWINLPVKDLTKTKEFFIKMGFSPNTGLGENDAMASFMIGEKGVVVNFFTESTFKSFVRSEIADATNVAEVLFSIDAQSRQEVDEMAQRAIAAGGVVFGEPEESQGWLYGCGFADLDGHRWNVLYMDMEKLPKA